MNNQIIYFDNASKTKPFKEVLDLYKEISETYFANPSSIHALGSRNLRMLDKSKEELLRLLKLNTHQVIYVSSATEANNLAIKGYALKYKNRGNHIITSAYEHASVLETCKQLEEVFGFEVTYLYPNEDGIITVDEISKNLKKETILVSIMEVNNEIGAINPISDIAKLLKDYPKIALHVDAAQSLGKMKTLTNYQDVDLLTISSHKLHGLIGVGALIKKKNISLLPLLSGGGQEYGFRSGTNDLALSLCLTKAVSLSLLKQKENYDHVLQISKPLIEFLKNNGDLFEINIPKELNPYIINFSTKTKKSSVVVEALSNQNIMVSSISACHSSKEKGSYVVKSLGKSEEVSRNTIRVSFSYENTAEEVEIFIETLKTIIGAIR